jgi:CyaY protein
VLDEEAYVARALPELHRLLEAIDRLDADTVEAELESDILTVEFEDGAKYVINSHRAARQIWMAAERSAWHFDWDEESQAWVSPKSGDELWATLARVVGNKLGKPIALR